MKDLRSEFLRRIVERGYLNQCTDLATLDALAAREKIVAYVGFDCTAPSLHVGSLVTVMALRSLQQTGHKPIVLMGGGTTKVGDPSGKDDARQLLADDEIARNMAGIKRVFSNFIHFGDGPTDAVMVNNADWLDRLEYIPFLRRYGRHFTVNRMLGFDSVRLRLEREQPLTFLEFNYMVLQAFDFLELHRRYGCVLQMGGSDQWGNIVNGVELGRRAANAALFGLTTPLITTASDEKMGKTARDAVWLNADELKPYDYWQYWRTSADGDVGRFLRLFTELSLEEVARLERLEGAEVNEAKKILAFEATRLCHGEAAAKSAAETAKKTFEEGGIGDELPTIEIPRAELEAGVAAYEILRRAGLCATGGEARRLIRGGGGRVNGAKITKDTQLVTLTDVASGGVIKLTAGRKRHALVRAV